MDNFFKYISEWAGIGALVPVMYVFALAGPFALFFLYGDNKSEVLKKCRWTLAICTYFSYFFWCLGTGSYIGKQADFTGSNILGINIDTHSLKMFVAIIQSSKNEKVVLID